MPSILIVDDDWYSSQYIRMAIQRSGAVTYTAKNARESVDIMRATPLDLIALDLALPDANGFEICAWARRHFPDIMLIVISGYDAVEMKVHAFESGADDFLVKPFAPAELIARIHALLRRKDRSATEKPSAAPPMPSQVIRLDAGANTLYLANNAKFSVNSVEKHIMELLLANNAKPVAFDSMLHSIFSAIADHSASARILQDQLHSLARKLARESQGSIRLYMTSNRCVIIRIQTPDEQRSAKDKTTAQ